MKHFGTIVFGGLTALSSLAVLWLSHGAGTGGPPTTVVGLAVSPLLYIIFVSPFALLFVVSLLRGLKN
jgi:hypothetical protein